MRAQMFFEMVVTAIGLIIKGNTSEGVEMLKQAGKYLLEVAILAFIMWIVLLGFYRGLFFLFGVS